MEKSEYSYRGYIIRKEYHPTPLNRARMTWDIYEGEKLKKSNLGSLDVGKHYIDVMLKYGYWSEIIG